MWDTRIEFAGDLSNGCGYFYLPNWYSVTPSLSVCIYLFLIVDSTAHRCNDTYASLLDQWSEYKPFFSITLTKITAVSIRFFCTFFSDPTINDESTFSWNYIARKKNGSNISSLIPNVSLMERKKKRKLAVLVKSNEKSHLH